MGFLPRNGCFGTTVWMHHRASGENDVGRKLHGNYTRRLHTVLNKSWKQHFTKQLLHNNLPSISLTNQVRRRNHTGKHKRNKDELVSNVILWTTTHGRTSVSWPAKTYVHQFCVETGCILEDLPSAITDGNGGEGRERENLGTMQSAWLDYIYIYIYRVRWVDFNQLNPVDGTHFGRPWCQRHGSGRVFLVSGHTSSPKL